MNKYRNKKCVYQGISFASQLERDRYIILQDAQKKGLINFLSLQDPFKLSVNGKHICSYIPDFHYFKRGKEVCEDTKGIITPSARIKILLAQAIYDHIEWRVIERPQVGSAP